MVEADTATDDILDLLFGVMGLMKSSFVQAIADLDLTPQQAHALRCLDPDRVLPMRDLATELHCDASTVTGLVDRLEQRGLVERRPDPCDRRVKGLAVTPAGATMRNLLREQMGRSASHLDVLTRAERAELRALLEKVIGR